MDELDRKVLATIEANPYIQLWKIGNFVNFNTMNELKESVNRLRERGLIVRLTQGKIGSNYPDWYEYIATDQL